MTLRIAVGSQKSYKRDAVMIAGERVFPALPIEVQTFSVPSGVAAQPLSNEESILGARNRAMRALEMADSNCNYGVGIENGLHAIAERWFATTWVVVVDQEGEEGVASTLMRPVPSDLIEHVLAGIELSAAIQNVYNLAPGETSLIGLITHGVLEKRAVLVDGILTALSDLVYRDVRKETRKG